MNELIPFFFEKKEIRVITDDGSIRVVAKDLAEAMGYTWNGSARIEHVPAEWRGVTSVVTPSGTQEMAYLTEQGMYFFLGRSDKPSALPLQKWVAGEVIPSIRKTGQYAVPARLPSPLELMVQQAQALCDIDRQQKAIASQQEHQAGVQAEQQVSLARVESRIEEVADRAKVLATRPTNTESITHMRPRLFKEYGLPARVVDEVVRQSPYALSPLVVANTKADVDGATYEVFHIKQVNAVFRRFVDECTRVTAAFVTHPYIEERFRLKPGFGRAAS